MPIRSLLLDFGGCIDAPGIHTRTLFWRAFRELGVVPETSRSAFQDAYTKADQRMMTTGEAKSLGLSAFNRRNAELIAEGLGLAAGIGRMPGDRVTAEMSGHLAAARSVLLDLSNGASLGIVSNFTGNLEVILEEFSLRSVFSSVTESFYEGVSKPHPKIFLSALSKQGFPPAECLFVGDNPVNDIEPAKKIGLKTALIYETSPRECGADAYIQSLAELSDCLRRL